VVSAAVPIPSSDLHEADRLPSSRPKNEFLANLAVFKPPTKMQGAHCSTKNWKAQTKPQAAARAESLNH
jgi:hypothetical protein